ncbi:hypothetical protein G6F57_008989 [Rhizopus arrhizus]|uniref:H+/nucleoside cotransporter n=1 Tax=Rhizopus oryzae TaxID=64495 RepID=A0A9P7BPW8_RHIOR|nr:hypothetical protein G6F21_008742 [Rhizopus arrhizus]KAG1417280.1 hypothetical protein G6F58_005586 [Rhizopus delemar]KAG0808555.1 hypothetical protein G6F20_009485 [Rhizopus arrhizus]KAG0825853.1 hypothetical protein G6F19_009594 [Rhizopus arrhizus]KAG0854741.1 hypothetical protein G6F17_006098 [Rhizopus arrhizus]
METDLKRTDAAQSESSISSHKESPPPPLEYEDEKKDSFAFDKMNTVEQAEYDDASHQQPSRFGLLYAKLKKHAFLIFWILFTGFFIASYAIQIPKGYSQELLILGLIYLYTTLYLFFCFVPNTIVTKPWNYVLNSISDILCRRFSRRVRTIAWAAIVVVVIVATVFSFPEKEESPRIRRLIALFGFIVLIFGTWITSAHPKAVQWNTISTAMFIQFILALFVFRSSVGSDIFTWLATFAEAFLGYSYFGSDFVFGDTAANSGVFAITVFPAIIFFASVVQMLYYLGTIQFVLKKLSVVCATLLDISGAESIVTIASPFIGSSENALLIEPLIKDLTKSEIHMIMTCGFATISGSTLYGYIAMGVSAKALLTSCIMSIPCSIGISKLRYPETEESIVKNMRTVPTYADSATTTNIIHAAGKGAKVGIEIVFLIMANLIALLSLLNAFNGFLTWAGNFLTIQNLTLQMVTGYVFVPIAWLIGVDDKDLVSVGTLMATKIWANEFAAYEDMTKHYKGMLSSRSELVATYALCGFANFGSVGTQVGVLSTLAPNRSGDVAKLAISALICGTLSTWLSASIAGMLV